MTTSQNRIVEKKVLIVVPAQFLVISSSIKESSDAVNQECVFIYDSDDEENKEEKSNEIENKAAQSPSRANNDANPVFLYDNEEEIDANAANCIEKLEMESILIKPLEDGSSSSSSSTDNDDVPSNLNKAKENNLKNDQEVVFLYDKNDDDLTHDD